MSVMNLEFDDCKHKPALMNSRMNVLRDNWRQKRLVGEHFCASKREHIEMKISTKCRTISVIFWLHVQ